MIEEYKKATLDLLAPTIKWNNHCIMYKSEKEAIRESAILLCEIVKPKAILEVGFGEGYTAEVFRLYAPRHRIIEVHPQLAQKARDQGYDVVESSIQDYRDSRHYDLLYDDHYPFPGMPEPDYRKFNHTFRAFVFHDYPIPGRLEFPFVVNGKTHYQHLEVDKGKKGP